jgi:hypothetical protein
VRELIGAMESSDDPAVAALRVIDHFDHLVEERATITAVVRATAALAGCPAGLHDAERGDVRRFDPEGRQLPGTEQGASARLSVPGRIGTWVWIERPATQAGPLDSLLLERAARTVQALHRSVSRTPDSLARVACDSDTTENDRRNAAQALGLCAPVTVVVSASPGLPVPHATTMGRYTVALTAEAPAPASGLRAGTAVAQDLAELPAALERAATAFRLTDRLDGPGASMMRHEDAGACAALAERFTPQDAAAVPDVQNLDEALGTHPWVVDTLQAALDQNSLRQAANCLHVHHSTLQERLAWVENRIDIGLARPGGRQRAAVALALWRIAHSEDRSPGR